jgi:type II secretory pathway component PulJ
MPVKTIIALLMALCLSGCAGLGAAAVVMQSLGNSMSAQQQQSELEDSAQRATAACRSGDQTGCIWLQNEAAREQTNAIINAQRRPVQTDCVNFGDMIDCTSR